MTGINHRRKNPIHAASLSRATKVEELRRSYRTLAKQAYPSRIASVRGGGIKEVMGRVVAVGKGTGEVDLERMARRRGHAVNERERGVMDATNPGSATVERVPSNGTTNTRSKSCLTVDDLLKEDNLAGIPERLRAHSGDPHMPHRLSTGDYRRDGEEDMLEEITEFDEGHMGMMEGGSDTSEDPSMSHPTRRHSFDVASVTQEEEPFLYSRQASSGAIGIGTTHEQPTYPYPESIAIPTGTPLLDNEQVNPQERPASSDSGWQEAGTLSSRDDDCAMDFDEDRGKFSDAGEDEEMLDCSDGGEAEVGAGRGPGEAFAESASMVDHNIAGAFEQERLADTGCSGEISRFFGSTTRHAATSGNDTAHDLAVDSWYPSGQALGHGSNTGEQLTAGRDTRETSGMPPLYVDNHASANAAGMQETFGSFVTEQTRQANDIFPDECNRQLEPQPEQHHLANCGSARPASPQDSGLGPFPGDFSSPLASNFDDMLAGMATTPASQLKVKTKSSKQARIIAYSDSPNAVEISRKTEFQIHASAEGGFIRPGRPDNASTFDPRAAAIAHLSVASRQPKPFDGSGSFYRWDQPFVSAKRASEEPSEADDSAIETFGSEPAFGRDIEAEAFQVLSGDTHVDTSDEETEKEDGQEDATFKHRLSPKFCPEDETLTMWRMAQWHQHADGSEAEHYRRFDPENEREAYQRLNRHRRRSERLAGNASRSDWPLPWIKNYTDDEPLSAHIRRSLRNAPSAEWEVIEDSPEMDLELLGEDGLPYVFEVVPSDPEGIDGTPHLPSDTTSPEAEGGNGVLLDVTANPFLEAQGPSSEDHANPNANRSLPTFDQVVVVYNYSNAATGCVQTGSGPPEENAGQKGYDEEAILQEVRDYLGMIVRMLAEQSEE